MAKCWRLTHVPRAEIVNKDPYSEGWMIKIKMTNPAELNELLTAEQYKGIINE